MATSAQLREQIAAGRWDGPLAALYGTAPQELARQRARYCAALEQFELYFGPGREVQVYSAPGRAELGGNHTDHQHGYGLAAAVTLDLVAVAARNTDGYVRVKSRGFNKLDVIDLATAEPQEGESTHSASLIRGIAEGFRTAGKAIGGFDAYTASDVLRGSGLSSSAAFEMGVACIWNGEYACGLDARALAGICQYAENTYFGKPSGQLDQLASAVGGVIFADFADPAAPQVEKIHADGLLPPGMTLCVTDTRGSHSELTGEFAARNTRNCRFSMGVSPGSSRFSSVVDRDQLLCLPLPFTPSKGFSCCRQTRPYLGAIFFIISMVSRLWSMASVLALSMKPQVFTRMTSASARSATVS